MTMMKLLHSTKQWLGGLMFLHVVAERQPTSADVEQRWLALFACLRNSQVPPATLQNNTARVQGKV